MTNSREVDTEPFPALGTPIAGARHVSADCEKTRVQARAKLGHSSRFSGGASTPPEPSGRPRPRPSPPPPAGPPRGRRRCGTSRCPSSGFGADRQAADRVPAEPLDLERVHLDRDGRPLAGRRCGGRSPCEIASRFFASAELIGTRGCAEEPRVVLDRAREALAQVDLGLPAEQVARARDVRLAHLRVVDRQRLEDDLRARLGQLDDQLAPSRAASSRSGCRCSPARGPRTRRAAPGRGSGRRRSRSCASGSRRRTP